ncbi:MAG: hypothetical protein KAQ94_00865 [Arcobacteraceae bacterium]|nr:hypothetical protein [Arcobacteraceae bacterium]
MALEEEKHIKAYSQNFTTMTPGSFQKKLRTNVIWQFIRFVIINLKMLVVVSKSH